MENELAYLESSPCSSLKGCKSMTYMFDSDTTFLKKWGLRVLPNKLKLIKKEAVPQGAASSIFRKWVHTYCACYKSMNVVLALSKFYFVHKLYQ